MPVQATSPAKKSFSQPLVVVLSAAAGGIVFDRWLGTLPGIGLLWWSGSGLALLFWWRAWRKEAGFSSIASLLLALSMAWGAWHQAAWNLFSVDELALATETQPQPVCVEATALAAPRIIPAPSPTPLRTIPLGDYSRLPVRITGVRNRAIWQQATGEAQLMVQGHLLGIEAGDRLLIWADVARPEPARNPGEFDFAEFGRVHRRLCELQAGFPDCVTVLERSWRLNPRRWIDTLRRAGSASLANHLAAQNTPLAEAILLGAREGIETEQREEFFVTGTVHLLAVSGLHVGILACGFWLATRLGLFTRRGPLLAAVAFVILYAMTTEARPPVVRAAVLITVMSFARIAGRRALSWNSLAAAALVVLAINPAQLFMTGAQLSFLAVATLIAFSSWFAPHPPADPLLRLIRNTRPWYVRTFRTIAGGTARLWLVGAVIWAIALPLTLSRFHLVTPSALVLNVLLWLPISVALFAGFSVVMTGWIFPPLAWLCGIVCNASLGLVANVVKWGSELPGAYFFTPGPPLWWVTSFYLGVAGLLLTPKSWCPVRWRLVGLLGLIALGVAASSWKQTEPPLRATFLAVGHGTCCVIELPGGETVLYDVGRLGSPDSAARAAAGFLWSRGKTHFDAVILSHADADHYNALPELLRRTSVGVVYVSPLMFEEETPALTELKTAIEASGAPLRELVAGDRMKVGGDARLEILHPPRRGVLGSDNANSIVLLVEHAGRRLLLPGDLESPGLDDLLAEEPLDCDVVMAPHHGSLRSNPAGFSSWSSPEYVIVSGGLQSYDRAVDAAFLHSGAVLLHTARHGATTFLFDRSGVRHETYLPPKGKLRSP